MKVEAPVNRLAATLCWEWILWPTRIEHLSEYPVGNGKAFEALSSGFDTVMGDHLWTNGKISTDDRHAAMSWLSKRCSSLPDWYENALATSGVSVDCVGLSPRVRSGGLSQWTSVLDRMDQDVLVTFLISEAHREHVNAYTDWQTMLRVDDLDIEALVTRGVADMHVHLGGARQPLAVWRRLLVGEVKLEDIPVYAPAKTNGQDGTRRAREKALIEKVLDRGASDSPRATLMDFAMSNGTGPSIAPILEAGSDGYAEWLQHRAEERFMLTEGWSAVRRAATDNSPVLSDIARKLDHYCWARSMVSAATRQPLESSVQGLADFARNWFRAVPQRRLTRSRRPKSARLSINEHSEALGALTESVPLRRLELRISPMKCVAEYRRFFRAWDTLERRIGVGGELDIKFAVHFQRHEAGHDPMSVMRKADRLSAALHIFRRDFPLEARRIGRIDLAGEERRAQGRWFMPYMRLLRGKIDLPELNLAQPQGCSPEWRRLTLAGHAGPLAGVDKLGASCHAGEDFPSLLCGLHEIALAIDILDLRAGDSIGHGLALSWNQQLFSRRSYGPTWIRAGEDYDALLWALGEIARAPMGHDGGLERFAISQQLGDLGARIYADDSLRSAPWLEWACEFHTLLRTPWSLRMPPRNTTFASLIARDFEDKDVIRRRNIALPVEQRTSPQLLAQLQEMLRQRVAELGIIVELNPSSNQRTSGAGSSQKSPMMEMLKRSDIIPIALSTDDPGVFDTCIENEYALASEMLMASGLPRREVLNRLEEIRRNGLERIAWPRTPLPRRRGVLSNPV